jgi:hypothetical protein
MTDDAKPRDPAGLVAALTLTGPGEPPADAEQLDLIPVSPTIGGEAGAAVAALRKAGRPPGARNRSTEEWRRHLLSKYTSPLEVLVATAASNAEDLAQDLHCTRAAAQAMRIQAASAALPYLHGKLPIEVNARGVTALVIIREGEDGALPQSETITIVPSPAADAESEQNQGSSASDPAPVGQSGVGQ